MTNVAKTIIEELAEIRRELVELKKAVSEILNEIQSGDKIADEIFCSRILDDLPNEIWRDIPGYDGLYQVSNCGRVKSFQLGNERILKLRKIVDGYVVVHLCQKRICKNFLVHRLVAEAFLPNPDNKSDVNHKDGDKCNNCLENLEWVTRSENVRHTIKTGRRKITTGIDSPRAKLTAEQVHYIREFYKPRDKKFGAKPLAKRFNVSISTITNLVCGETYKNLL